MNRITRRKNNNYTVVSNVFLKDKNLSLKAKGFLAVVMGLPDDWDFSINGICLILKEGKTAIYNTINELKEFGYCKVEICRDPQTKIITGNDYSFFEEPNFVEPDLPKPYSENPNAANNTQLNTYNNKNNKQSNIDKIKIELSEFVSSEFIEIMVDWLEYKKDRKEKYSSSKSIKACYNKLLKLSGSNPVKAREIIEQSMANNWAGLFELKETSSKQHPTRLNHPFTNFDNNKEYEQF